MYNTINSQVLKPGQDALHNVYCPLLPQPISLLGLFEYGHEISPLAILSNDVTVIAGHKHIIAPDDVGVVELFEYANLGLEHLPVGRRILPQIDDFDGELLEAVVLAGFEDSAGVALPDQIAQVVAVLLDPLPQR